MKYSPHWSQLILQLNEPCLPIFITNLPSGVKILISLLPASATIALPVISTDKFRGLRNCLSRIPLWPNEPRCLLSQLKIYTLSFPLSATKIFLSLLIAMPLGLLNSSAFWPKRPNDLKKVPLLSNTWTRLLHPKRPETQSTHEWP